MISNYNKITVPFLKDSERILLWSFREWALNIKIAKDPRPKLIEGFSKILIQEAVMPLDKLLRVVGYHYKNPIDIRCHCSNQIGRTEADLLCLISILQNKKKYEGYEIIKNMNTEQSSELIKYTKKLIESLNRAEIILPIRREFVNKYFKIQRQNKSNIIYFDFKNKLYA